MGGLEDDHDYEVHGIKPGKLQPFHKLQLLPLGDDKGVMSV